MVLNHEIGSEFWNVPICEKKCNVFERSMQWYLSGRNALQAVIQDIEAKKKIRTVAMPSWCCHTMIAPFVEAGIEVYFYPVYWDKSNGNLRVEISTVCDALFLMDYFGYYSDITANHPCIIRDVTHSVFSHTYTDADYYFGSLRKWCGVWTGGYAWTREGGILPMKEGENGEYIMLREKAMRLKERHIQGYPDKTYLEIFRQAENLLDTCSIMPAACRDIGLAGHLDVEFIKIRRRKNAEILMDALKEYLVFPKLKDTDCPLSVPIYVPDGKRERLRHYLKKHKIYCPVHWPVSSYHVLDEKTAFLYRNGISLVCDQRYTERDMQKMVYVIKKFWKEERICSQFTH